MASKRHSAAKKKTAARARAAPRIPAAGPSSELKEGLHRFNVLLEDVRSQQTVMLEAMSSMRAHFDQKLDDGLRRVEARLDVLEAVVRKNSEDIRKNSEDIRKNSEDIEAMKVELRRLRVDFEARDERVKLEALEQRVARLEQRLAG